MAKDKKREDDCWKRGSKEDCGPGKGEPSLFKKFSKGQFNFSIWYFVAAVVILLVINSLVTQNPSQLIEFSEFKDLIRSGVIKRVELGQEYYLGLDTTSGTQVSVQDVTVYRTVPINDPEFISMLDENGVQYYAERQRNNYLLNVLLSWVLPFGVLLIIWRFMLKRMGNMGSNVMSFGQNKAVIVAEGSTGVTFADVAGADEAKDELVEVVDFLMHPAKYTEIGGRIPKGVLLIGAPGTGKTLLARAVAGESHVPFFKMSGADFVEMFVGVGAARVRDMFKQAREKAPCIVFIDELDAIGKSRLSGVYGGNDEREQTLNQLLVEMDGFDSTTGVILLAATNRPEILDPALLRPGRFDRQVLVDKPDLNGRRQILQIHSKNVKLDESVDLTAVARSTPGFVGADLANIVNESALLAVRSGRKTVIQADFSEAIEKVVAGLAKKNKVINPKERKVVAYHETGHALVAAFTEGSDPVHKISIVPRGMGALGYTLQTPEEDRYLMGSLELKGRIDVLLGGRAAEEIVFDEISTGASNDLTKATDIARRMITDYGMSERFKNVALTKHGGTFLGGPSEPVMTREYSENTQQYIDEEIARIIEASYSRAVKLLEGKRELLDQIAEKLLQNEIIEAEEFKGIVTAGV